MIKILLIDDHTLVREGMMNLLSGQSDMEVVANSADGAEGLLLAQEFQPQVVVLDVAMPGLNGIEMAKRLKDTCPDTRVLALSMHSDAIYVRGMVDAGAYGYILKDAAFKELVMAIRAVSKGRRFFSADLGFVATGARSGTRKPFGITPRETEVLRLISDGDRTVDIARKLGISGKTVETHRRRMMTKLGLDSVSALVKYAIKHGISTLD
ncbi:MAG: response regulator transcription factor [Candidatus Sedimenticola sp. (ex Thyasira tokunagai)]